jgi:N-acetylneuraminic acid mutarotase
MRFVAFVASLALALATLDVHAQSEGWSERAPMLLPRSEISIADHNGKIYVIGGYPGERITAAEVQIYDSRTDTWSLGPPLPHPLHHTMASVVDGQLFVIGGEAGNPVPGQSVFQDRVFQLDEAAGTWRERAPMPTARSGGGSAVIDGKIYVAGGRPPRGADLAVYDPKTDHWVVLPDIPTQRNHLGVGAIDGKLYVAGGRFGGGVGSPMTGVLEVFDPRTLEWSTAAPLLTPRAGVAAVAADGCLYLIGGEGNDADPRGVFDLNEVYDPATNTWQRLAPLPLAQHGLTGAAFLDGLIYIPGGATRRGVSGPDVTLKLQTFKTTLTCGPSPR